MPSPDPIWSVSVTRDALNEAPLILTDGIVYWIARGGIGPGAASFRKQTTTSPWLEGRYPTNIIADTQVMKVDVRVRAPDSDWMDFYLAQVQQAFSQWSYLLQVSIDGVRHHWSCECADGWALGSGGQYDDIEAASFEQHITFNVPRMPTPAYGRL